MKRLLSTVVTLMMLATMTAVPLSAQPRFGLDPENWTVVRHWLENDCLAPSPLPFLTDLRVRSAVMQRAFLAALEEGPAPEDIARIRETARVRYRARREALDRPEVREALPQDRLEVLREITEERFVARAVSVYTTRWNSNAMAGLAVVGDADAIARLQSYVRQSGELGAAARAALAYRELLSQ